MTICSPDRPWGLHPALRSDEDCPRCGWTAPGPKGDSVADSIEAAAEALGRSAGLGWTVRGGASGEAALAA